MITTAQVLMISSRLSQDTRVPLASVKASMPRQRRCTDWRICPMANGPVVIVQRAIIGAGDGNQKSGTARRPRAPLPREPIAIAGKGFYSSRLNEFNLACNRSSHERAFRQKPRMGQLGDGENPRLLRKALPPAEP